MGCTKYISASRNFFPQTGLEKKTNEQNRQEPQDVWISQVYYQYLLPTGYLQVSWLFQVQFSLGECKPPLKKHLSLSLCLSQAVFLSTRDNIQTKTLPNTMLALVVTMCHQSDQQIRTLCQVPCDFVTCISEEILLSSTAPPQRCNFNPFPPLSLSQSGQAAPICVQGWLKGLIFSEASAIRTVQCPTPFPHGWVSICDGLGISHRIPGFGDCLLLGVHSNLEVLSLKGPLKVLVLAQRCSLGFISIPVLFVNLC